MEDGHDIVAVATYPVLGKQTQHWEPPLATELGAACDGFIAHSRGKAQYGCVCRAELWRNDERTINTVILGQVPHS